ncbi:MAG: hypothetical protein HQL87_06815 [Magnetococcales bacterium]|nr:hypothetical protein [Magnetococcales bacterium]
MIQAIEAVCINGAITPLEPVCFEEAESLVILRLSRPPAHPVRQDQPPPVEPAGWRRFAGILKASPNFNGDPVAIQREMRDEWH